MAIPPAEAQLPDAIAALSPLVSSDTAWVSVPAPFGVAQLTAVCHDLEALFRVNPYFCFKVWRQTGVNTYHMEIRNESNAQDVVLDLEVVPDPAQGFIVNYAQGIKRRTVFAILSEPAAGAGAHETARLVIADDYDRIPEAERAQRAQEVDKSLAAWGEALRVYFRRLKRWSWLPGWRWYVRRVWIPMRPPARRIVWLISLITVVEFFFFLFVLLIYVVEQRRDVL